MENSNVFRSSRKSRNRGTNYTGLYGGVRKIKRKKSLTRSQSHQEDLLQKRRLQKNHPVIPVKPLSNVFRVTQLFRAIPPPCSLLTKSIDLPTDRIIAAERSFEGIPQTVFRCSTSGFFPHR